MMYFASCLPAFTWEQEKCYGKWWRNINPIFDCFLSEMWYWVFLWALFSSLFVHGAVGVLMFVMLQRHRQGRLISVIVVSIGFLGSITGAMITSAAVAGIYRVAGKNMAPLEALVFGVGQTVLTLIISFSRILATL
ncbi:PREDICTED: transmembrane protein 170B-like [Tauraco erythrolophus]|uniref:transmembrane protein 170B-like n=1 Tax=Tauraco erythrolophus TaxID=121530 RepID=UPI000523B58B|nr:PREDICTED: transmembrane protein 170B-like [Tauraco erythrolophus]